MTPSTAWMTIPALLIPLIFITRVVVPEGHVALLYRNGLFRRPLAPGRYFLPRFDASWTLVDMRLRMMTIAGQEVLSRDNAGLKVSLAVAWHIADAERSAHLAQDAETMLRTSVQLAAREAIAGREIEQLIADRADIGESVLVEVREAAAALGLRVDSVQVKDISFPGELKRIFSEVVKARQLGRAALERARGESAALRNLVNAARLLEQHPALMNARLLQTISAEGGNTLVMNWPERLVPLRDKDCDTPAGPKDQ